MNVDSWMNQTVTLAQAMGVNSYGEPTYGAGSAIACRIQPKIQMVRKAKDGSEAQSTHTIYTTSAVGIEDGITLPGEAYPRLPLTVFTEVDKQGNTVFFKVLL